MTTSNLIIVLLFLMLTIPNGSRKAAFVYLIFYSFYIPWVVPLAAENDTGKYYYLLTSTFNFVVMSLLISKYFWVGFLSFVLIPVNFFGWILYENYYPPTTYDNIAKTIIFIQIVLLIVRGLNGLNHIYSRLPYGDWLVRAANLNGYQAYKTLYKS